MKNKRRVIGLISSLVGFGLILLNATSYLLKWEISNPAMLIMGITFFILGGFAANKSVTEQTN